MKAGESVTIDGIPTGTECTVSEVKPTDPPAGWSFSEPTYDPANGKVTVSEKGGTVAVTVTNEILKPGINIVKTASATPGQPRRDRHLHLHGDQPRGHHLGPGEGQRRQVRTGDLPVR
ncbi:MAG: hypothetical protein IPG68_01120 [Micrococcales bacterium]|nr:hypothetical protein [Micrococcales bacterium]